MRDLEWNIAANDLVYRDDGWDFIEYCSIQNANLILRKSCANIQLPQYGVGLENWFPNVREEHWNEIAGRAESQMKLDYYPRGPHPKNAAVLSVVKLHRAEDGRDVIADIYVRYKTE